MATWYVDPENGNDANDGTTFANRVQNFGAFTPAAGDNVRIIANIDPWSLGDGTWTDNSGTISLAAAQTLTVDNCETAWAAGANVTANTTSGSARRQGSECITFGLASGFVTGSLIGYKTLPSTLDLSAYSCISLWLGLPTTPTVGTGVNVALCSDTLGQVPLVTLPMDTFFTGVSFSSCPVLFENGGAALPSGVNSIALYANGKPFTGAGTIAVDNIIATTAANTAGHLSHQCVIGKNSTGEPEWYPIQSIDGTTVVIGGLSDNGTATPTRKYRGVTETVATYAMLGVRTRFASLTGQQPKGTGTVYAQISWSGGWDRTAMSSQTGKTWLNGMGFQSYCWYNSSGQKYHAFPDATVGFIGFALSALRTTTTPAVLHFAGATNCASPITGGSSATAADYAWDNLTFCGGSLSLSSNAGGKYKLRVRRITSSTSSGWAANDTWDDANHDIQIGQIDNCTTGITMQSGTRSRLRGCTFLNNAVDINEAVGSSGGMLLLDRPVFPTAPVISTGAATLAGGFVRMTSVNGASWDNRIYTYAVTQLMDQSVVHGTTEQSVKVTVIDYSVVTMLPHLTRIARIACLAGKTVTFSAWMQRSDSTNLACGIMVQGGNLAGVDDTSYAASAASSTWEQGTLTFTPTEDGAIDVLGYVQALTASANTASAWFGDTAATSS